MSLYNLKKAIYGKLKDDSALITLLGGNSIFYKNPSSKASYPQVIYDIILDKDRPFNENDNESKITETSVEIIIFSKEDTSQQSDEIESRIKAVLSGDGKLTDSDIICYNSYRTSMSSQRRDESNRIWITNSIYLIKWALQS